MSWGRKERIAFRRGKRVGQEERSGVSVVRNCVCCSGSGFMDVEGLGSDVDVFGNDRASW
jgi:hypothetical protein